MALCLPLPVLPQSLGDGNRLARRDRDDILGVGRGGGGQLVNRTTPDCGTRRTETSAA